MRKAVEGCSPVSAARIFRVVPSPFGGEGVEQADHAVDDLDGGMSGFVHVSHYET
jgi:hypothetical protein